jgi:hypothetical protein
MPKKTPKTDAPADPDALAREAPGRYRSGDGRFEARQADIGWFLVDTEQANELGQELIHGPFATLKALKSAIGGARRSKVTPMPRPKRASAAARRDAPPEPPPSWIDRLPASEARVLRRRIAALEREGIEDAELLVRRDRDGLLPAVAVRRLERLAAGALEAESVPEAVQRVLEIVSAEGRATDDLPGWALVEIGPGEDPPPNRRIDLRR